MLISSAGEITSLQRGGKFGKEPETSVCRSFTPQLTFTKRGGVKKNLKAELNALTAFNTTVLSSWEKYRPIQSSPPFHLSSSQTLFHPFILSSLFFFHLCQFSPCLSVSQDGKVTF